jgi:two-component system sensor histidine kinase RegB
MGVEPFALARREILALRCDMADASLKNAPHSSPRTGLDKPDVEATQDEDWSWAGPGLRRGRLRVRTLIAQRWLMVVGQAIAVLVAGWCWT